LQLTEEQRDIVTHYQGAAIVYAVAGAGKSTTMAYRVQHLVNTHGVDPQRILVCSFSKATVNDIQQKIANLGVPRVACYTFNALGRKIVQKAVQDGFFTAFDEEHIEHRNSQLAMRALVELGKQYGKNFSQLDINQEDLQTYISVCKGNLCYANILAAKLPPHTLAYAEQAEHKNAHYLKAYQLYEQIRQQHNWLTFDDQLVLAWEALERFDSIRAWAKNSFDFVLIDEFQDVNKVQVQIADILTEDHRNYMAIGDDDQCIYEWRGADVRYILDFKKRYQAQAYIISDNFRCPAEATLLAGKVIAQNKERQPKDLVSQKGFGGGVVLQGFKNEEDSAQYVVNCYKNLLTQGTHPKDCIVLVRTYSQTSVIEAKLIQEELAYQVIGNQRFYERAEVKVLFTYLSFARQERDYQQSGTIHQTLERTIY
jgi:DNA helicase-2/ATP-dependent DNA helicase PcrA